MLEENPSVPEPKPEKLKEKVPAPQISEKPRREQNASRKAVLKTAIF